MIAPLKTHEDIGQAPSILFRSRSFGPFSSTLKYHGSTVKPRLSEFEKICSAIFRCTPRRRDRTIFIKSSSDYSRAANRQFNVSIIKRKCFDSMADRIYRIKTSKTKDQDIINRIQMKKRVREALEDLGDDSDYVCAISILKKFL